MSTAHCVVTVTSDDFAPGTVVMLDSFRRTNPWFGGDMLVVADRLSPDAAAMIGSIPGARIVPVGADLSSALERLRAARPELGDRIARFHSLEAFRLRGYERILFFDSDLLFLETIEPLLSFEAPLLGVADNAARRGRARDRRTFVDVDRALAAPDALYPTLNAGMMVIHKALHDHWPELLAALNPACWQDVGTGHTDQIVVNRLFSSRARLVDDAYNYILGRHSPLTAGEIEAARVLHFNGPAKPWLLPAMHRSRRDPLLFGAMARWIAAHGQWQNTLAAHD